VEEYPDSWDDYVGQTDVVQLLRCAAESARRRNEPMDHVLIACADGGVGKTALAHLVAKEIGSDLHVITEPLETSGIRKIVEEMQDFDVLFIDEVHRFKKVTWMHHLMQDRKITGRGGRLVAAPRITLIAATTEPNKLDPTVLSRFQYTPMLKPLTVDEAIALADQMSAKIFSAGLARPLSGCLRGVAIAANCNPRIMKQLLRTVRDLAATDHTDWVEGYGWRLDSALRFRGLHYDGLTVLALEYLRALQGFGGQAGKDTIAGTLGERDGLVGVERLLLSKGLIERDRAGRLLTRAGRQRLREEDEAA